MTLEDVVGMVSLWPVGNFVGCRSSVGGHVSKISNFIIPGGRYTLCNTYLILEGWDAALGTTWEGSNNFFIVSFKKRE